MLNNTKLTKQKVQFIKSRTLMSFIISLVLIVLLFFVCFFVQSAKNQSETAAIIATRENINTKKERQASPVPIVEITESAVDNAADDEDSDNS